MVTQGDRFKEIREYNLKLSQKELADILNTSQATISAIETGAKQKIDTDILKTLVHGYNIDLSYLLLGTPSSNRDDNCIPVPFYNIGIAAGSGKQLDDETEKEAMYFDKRWLKNVLGVDYKNLALVYASGDSMDSGFNLPNDIKDGDLLLVDTSQTEGNNKTYVIRVNNQELRVKQLVKKFDGTLHILSANSKYKDEVYTPNNELTIEVIGRVVWNGSKENI